MMLMFGYFKKRYFDNGYSKKIDYSVNHNFDLRPNKTIQLITHIITVVLFTILILFSMSLFGRTLQGELTLLLLYGLNVFSAFLTLLITLELKSRYISLNNNFIEVDSLLTKHIEIRWNDIISVKFKKNKAIVLKTELVEIKINQSFSHSTLALRMMYDILDISIYINTLKTNVVFVERMYCVLTESEKRDFGLKLRGKQL